MMTINLLLGIAQAGEQAVRRRNAIARRRAFTEAFRRVRVDREIDRCMAESRRVLGRPSVGLLIARNRASRAAARALDDYTASLFMRVKAEARAQDWPTYG